MKSFNRQLTMGNSQWAIGNGQWAILLFSVCIVIFSACKDNTSKEPSANSKEQWTCSMHPEVVRDQPGTCPICGMDLVRKVNEATAIGTIHLNDLLQPTDRFVVSSVPVTTIQTREKSIEVEALGTVAYDTRLVSTISARISGRIEKLYVKYRYQHVKKGQKIMDIYSPELLTTQQELIYLVRNDPSNTSLINAAKQKLLLLGVSQGQLQQVLRSGKPSLTVAVYSNRSGHIHEAGNVMPGAAGETGRMDVARITEQLSIKEGMYVEKGQNIFQLYDVNRSWALLSIFPEYLSLVRKGDVVRVVPETDPNKDFRARIDFIEPFYRQENKTLTARVYFDNSELQIPVGSQVKATVFADNKEAGWLPRDAVLSLGMDKVVFIKQSGGFKAHRVETGLLYENLVQIVSGLRPTDSVAANAQYLTDSESFIKANDRP